MRRQPPTQDAHPGAVWVRRSALRPRFTSPHPHLLCHNYTSPACRQAAVWHPHRASAQGHSGAGHHRPTHPARALAGGGRCAACALWLTRTCCGSEAWRSRPTRPARALAVGGSGPVLHALLCCSCLCVPVQAEPPRRVPRPTQGWLGQKGGPAEVLPPPPRSARRRSQPLLPAPQARLPPSTAGPSPRGSAPASATLTSTPPRRTCFRGRRRRRSTACATQARGGGGGGWEGLLQASFASAPAAALRGAGGRARLLGAHAVGSQRSRTPNLACRRP